MRATRAAPLALALALAVLPGRAADRIVLESGGTIEAVKWWYEGDDVKVQTASGLLTVPRSMVVRIEKAPPAATPSPAPAPARTSPAAPPPGADDRAAEVAKLVDEGADALRARDFDTAMRRFHEAVVRDPDRSDARAGYALAEMALGRDPAALAAVLDGLARDPGSADLHEVLGDLRDREERVDDALASWREAFRIAPNDRRREKILKAERELAAGRDYAFSAAAHFNVRYDGEVDPDLAAAVEDYLEERFRELTSAYRYAPTQPITVIVYPRQDFHAVTQVGDSVAGLFDGKIRVPLGGLKRLEDRARRVLSHELVHAIVQAKSRGTCPRWLHEGLAQIAEPRAFGRAEQAEVAKLAASADPLAWMDGAFSYPAALSLTRYLEERRGFGSIVRVLERLGSGEGIDDAFRAEFSSDLRELERSWVDSVRETGAR